MEDVYRKVTISGFERYKVSRSGKVMSPKGRVLKPYVDIRNPNRLPIVTLKTLKNESSSFTIKALIDSAFNKNEQSENLILLNINDFTYDYVFNKIEDLRIEQSRTWVQMGQIAKTTGLKSKIAKGQLKVNYLIEICKFFEIPISYFFGGDGMLEIVNGTLKVQISNLKSEINDMENKIKKLSEELADKNKIIMLYDKLNKDI